MDTNQNNYNNQPYARDPYTGQPLPSDSVPNYGIQSQDGNVQQQENYPPQQNPYESQTPYENNQNPQYTQPQQTPQPQTTQPTSENPYNQGYQTPPYDNGYAPQGNTPYGTNPNPNVGYYPPQGGYSTYDANTPNPAFMQPPQEEKASVGLAILSFFIPLAGIIIYFTQKDKKPKTAKASGKCALASIIINVVITIIACLISFGVIGTAFSVADEYGAFDDSSYSDSYDESYYDDYSYEDDASLNEDSADNSASVPYIDATGADSDLGNDRAGYVNVDTINETWTDFTDPTVTDENIAMWSNGSEIVTLAYYDGTGYTTEDLRNSVVSSMDSVNENTEGIVNQLTFDYDDFYGEGTFSKDEDGYQLYTMFFQSDETDDMIYIAAESSSMSDSEFETFVNRVVNTHSLINHDLEITY